MIEQTCLDDEGKLGNGERRTKRVKYEIEESDKERSERYSVW